MATIPNGTTLGTVHVPSVGPCPVKIRQTLRTDKTVHLVLGVDIPPPPGDGEPLIEEVA